jgi:hypothetical protein
MDVSYAHQETETVWLSGKTQVSNSKDNGPLPTDALLRCHFRPRRQDTSLLLYRLLYPGSPYNHDSNISVNKVDPMNERRDSFRFVMGSSRFRFGRGGSKSKVNLSSCLTN